MNLHEYQSKELFSHYNIPIPVGFLATTIEQVKNYVDKLNNNAVIKAQIHSGGRGKAGGVKLVSSIDESESFTKSILGKFLITPQTGSKGIKVNKLLVEEATSIDREIYFSIVIDNNDYAPMIICSTEGGMDIEEVSRTMPEKIIKTVCSPILGVSNYKIRKICEELNIPKSLIPNFTEIVNSLYKLFIEKDCILVEINPLVITKEQKVIALDAKINIDDDALFRQKSLKDIEDKSQLEKLEIEANRNDLSYVKLEGGKVGCMVNGAGLAMATMDITKWAGAQPANFLDIGGSATVEKIESAFKIIVSDKDVEVILVNLFAGIARSDVVANGIINAAKETESKIPLVISMRGTNSEEGLKLLNNSNLDITTATDLENAANILKQKLSQGDI